MTNDEDVNVQGEGGSLIIRPGKAAVWYERKVGVSNVLF